MSMIELGKISVVYSVMAEVDDTTKRIQRIVIDFT